MSRRGWLNRLVLVLSFALLQKRNCHAQTPSDASTCELEVSDDKGKGISKLVIEIIEPNGRVSTATERANGHYDFSAPQSGPYVLIMYERGGNTTLYEMRSLTSGAHQSIAVTFDPMLGGFSSLYNALQGVESLAAAVIGNRDSAKVASAVFETIPRHGVLESVATMMAAIRKADLSEMQRNLLQKKADFVIGLVGVIG